MTSTPYAIQSANATGPRRVPSLVQNKVPIPFTRSIEFPQNVVKVAERERRNADREFAGFGQTEDPVGVFGERLAVGR
jgi:hypothetical protein